MSVGTRNASSLLRIDFDAALAKLAWSQLQGAWQLPAELTRLAIGAGAQSVRLEIEPRHLALTAPGARLDQRTLADFASLLDRGLSAEDRHRALVDLEERDAFVLSAIACSQPRALRLATGGERSLMLALAADGVLGVSNPSGAAPAEADLRLTVEGLGIEVEKAARWLRRVGRFAELPITIGGVPIDRGFRAPLITLGLEVPPAAGLAAPGRPPGRPLPATLAIPRHGSAPRLWLLRHGIIATHATVPGYPSFEAAVEMAPVSGPGAGLPGDDTPSQAPRVTGAALRARLNPYVETLVDAAVGLTLRLASGASELPEEVRARASRLLLQAALKRRRLSEVSGAAMVPLVSAGSRRLVSIDVVGRLVRVEEGGALTLDAIDPGQDPRRFALSGHGALAVSQGERALLGELLAVVFSSPPARARQGLGRRWLDQATARLSLLRRARGVAAPFSELDAAERDFLSRLRALEDDGTVADVAFGTGGGRVSRDREGALRLPRDNPLVRACVRSVARDGAGIYPAVVALLGGRELPGPEMRRQWFATLED